MSEPKLCFARVMTKGYPIHPVTGLRVCRYCKGPLAGRRTSFCSDACVHEFLLRTDPGYVRKEVFKRDAGVCVKCGTDTEKLRLSATVIAWTRTNRLPRQRNGERNDDFRRRESIYSQQRSIAFSSAAARAGELFKEGWPSPERSWWEADHIIEVRDGGGCCGLENYQTLCVPCHKSKTISRTCKRA